MANATKQPYLGQMFTGVHTPTRVVGVDDDHCGGVLVSNRLQRVDVNFPPFLRNQIERTSKLFSAARAS